MWENNIIVSVSVYFVVKMKHDEMTVPISNSRHIIEASSTIQKNLKAIELDMWFWE